MDIRHRTSATGGEFLLEDDGRLRGELTYRRDGHAAVVTHTRVDRELRGTGLGRRLVEAAIAWSRGAGVHLGATCWYARQVLERSPGSADHPAHPST